MADGDNEVGEAAEKLTAEDGESKNADNVVVKVGLLGDAQVGGL